MTKTVIEPMRPLANGELLLTCPKCKNQKVFDEYTRGTIRYEVLQNPKTGLKTYENQEVVTDDETLTYRCGVCSFEFGGPDSANAD